MVPVEEVVQLYSHAAVFVCPSVYEPFGLINLEAMACETPVVASAVGGILEVVEDGKTGVLVEPGRPDALVAAIRALLEDPARGRAMGRAGRRRVEGHFSWASVATRTREVYQDAIADFARSAEACGACPPGSCRPCAGSSSTSTGASGVAAPSIRVRAISSPPSTGGVARSASSPTIPAPPAMTCANVCTASGLAPPDTF